VIQAGSETRLASWPRWASRNEGLDAPLHGLYLPVAHPPGGVHRPAPGDGDVGVVVRALQPVERAELLAQAPVEIPQPGALDGEIDDW